MSLLPINTNGYLELIIGPMFSGKTSRLLEIYKKCQIVNIDCLIINHKTDNRFTTDSRLSSHSLIEAPCELLSNIYYHIKRIPTSDKTDVSKKIMKSQVILINEGQFFSDIKQSVMLLVEKYNKIVYVCGLDGDFKRKTFGSLLELIPFCDKVEKLPSLCKFCCNGNTAIFSHRISHNDSQTLIGGEDEYIPLCRQCYIQHNLTRNPTHEEVNIAEQKNNNSIITECFIPE